MTIPNYNSCPTIMRFSTTHTLSPLHCSSSRERRPMGRVRKRSSTGLLSLYVISSPSRPSLAYSTCRHKQLSMWHTTDHSQCIQLALYSPDLSCSFGEILGRKNVGLSMSECVGIWLYFVGFKIRLEGFRTWWSHRMLVIPITISWGTRRLGWVTVQEDTQRYGSFHLQWHHITCKILSGFPFNFSLKLWDNIWGEGLGTRATCRTFGAPWLAFSMANIWWLKYCCSCSLA